jgi:hypothetical protein
MLSIRRLTDVYSVNFHEAIKKPFHTYLSSLESLLDIVYVSNIHISVG